MVEEIVPVLRVADADVDAVVTEFGRPAGEQPYGCEFELRDPDGNRLRISTRDR
jgi:hypothetical protein